MRTGKFTGHSKRGALLIAILATLLSACGSPEDRANLHATDARELFEQGDYVSAKIEAMNAAQIEPRNVDARFMLAQIEEKNGNYRAAVGHLQVAIDADPSHVPARLKLGNYYVLAKAADLATEQANAVLALAPDNAEAHLLSARAAYLTNEQDKARREVETALELDPLLAEAIMWKAGAHMRDGDFDTALQLIDDGIRKVDDKKIVVLRKFRIVVLRAADRPADVEADLKALTRDFPEDESYALILAQLYSSQSRIDEAEEILRRIIARNPADIDRRIQFSQFIAENRSVDQSVEVLKEFIAELPDALALRLTLGRLYEATGSREDALAFYREIAAASPDSEEGLTARNRIAIIMIADGQSDDARIMIDKILADDQNNIEALLVRATFKFSDRAYEDAIADLRTVLRADEASEHALLLLARAHVGAESTDLAMDAYRRLISINAAHPAAVNELAELLAKRGDMDSAADVLRQRLKIVPADRKAASSLIQVLLIQGDIDAAEKAARNMLALENDGTGLAEFQLGRVMQAKESGPEAIAAYERSLQKNPAAVEPLQGLVTVYVDGGQFDEAISYLDTHLTEYPAQPLPKLLLGSVYARKGDVEIAERIFDELIAEQPKIIRTYAALADLYAGDPVARISVYRRGLDADPQNPAIGLLLGTEYEKSGQYEDAISLYEIMLEKNPDNGVAANNLAALLLDYRSAPESHSKALALAKRFADSEQPALVDTLGWAYYRNSEYIKAIQYLKIAVDGADQSPILHYHLGMAYFAVQQLPAAREELEKATVLANADYPGINEARDTLDAIRETMRQR